MERNCEPSVSNVIMPNVETLNLKAKIFVASESGRLKEWGL
jgi:hypothetical protein